VPNPKYIIGFQNLYYKYESWERRQSDNTHYNNVSNNLQNTVQQTWGLSINLKNRDVSDMPFRFSSFNL